MSVGASGSNPRHWVFGGRHRNHGPPAFLGVVPPCRPDRHWLDRVLSLIAGPVYAVTGYKPQTHVTLPQTNSTGVVMDIGALPHCRHRLGGLGGG